MKRIYHFGPAALLCLFVLYSCNKPQPPKYLDFENIRLQKAGLSESIIAVDFKFYNPNNFGMQMKEADLDVYFNDKYIGHSRMDTLIQVSRLDTFYIPIALKLQLKDLFKNALQVILNPEVMVKVQGNARIGKGGIFINYPINYEGKQRIDVLLKDSNLLKEGF